MIGKGQATLKQLKMALNRVRRSRNNQEPHRFLNAMDHIAELIYDNPNIQEILPLISKRKFKSELDSTNLYTGSFHLVSLFQENYCNRGFAIPNNPIAQEFIRDRTITFDNCDGYHVDYERWNDYSFNIFYSAHNRTPYCWGCEGIGFQGNFFLRSLTEDLPPPEKNIQDYFCYCTDEGIDMLMSMFETTRRRFICLLCIRESNRGKIGQHFVFEEEVEPVCCKCGVKVMNKRRVSECIPCHREVLNKREKINRHKFKKLF